ncbi:hypothetical protein CEXT_417641 [Caerostris extrusa]|uniref:Uncharacterized protein n=1 Tax=Caerostris extrusa TaxID=172846 RepID=A0AAV4MLZ0_CAEEX|nr:hypothetical protein CEXT_417641 [Caerostris extrusa]
MRKTEVILITPEILMPLFRRLSILEITCKSSSAHGLGRFCKSLFQRLLRIPQVINQEASPANKAFRGIKPLITHDKDIGRGIVLARVNKSIIGKVEEHKLI